MKNIISSIIINSVLSLSFAQAKNIQDNFEAQIATNKAASISQSDMDFLFNNASQVDVALLDDQEMRETKGEFWPTLVLAFGVPIAAGFGNWLSNGIFNKWFR